ncbi:hypothetical protein H0H93_000575 [Arthromyces matolae]|nr:hypothetical protein H0H93_000575 [Arthromyces matolae]
MPPPGATSPALCEDKIDAKLYDSRLFHDKMAMLAWASYDNDRSNSKLADEKAEEQRQIHREERMAAIMGLNPRSRRFIEDKKEAVKKRQAETLSRGMATRAKARANQSKEESIAEILAAYAPLSRLEQEDIDGLHQNVKSFSSRMKRIASLSGSTAVRTFGSASVDTKPTLSRTRSQTRAAKSRLSLVP